MPTYEVSVIPTDMLWQPGKAAAAEAETCVREFYSGPGQWVEDVSVSFSDRIMVVQPGLNLSHITCPGCQGDIPVEWYWGFLARHGEEVDSLEVTAPCCGTNTALDALLYDVPVGYARFKIVTINPGRADELTAEELAVVADILGRPLRQIFGFW